MKCQESEINLSGGKFHGDPSIDAKNSQQRSPGKPLKPAASPSLLHCLAKIKLLIHDQRATLISSVAVL